MRKGEETRQRIVSEAAVLLNRHGFEGCSMGDIMQATGLEKGGLYRHFKSKEALAEEALQYSLTRAFEVRFGGLDKVQGAAARLLHVIDRFVTSPSPVPGGCPLLNASVDSDDGNPALLAIVRRGLCAWKKQLAEIVESGVATGEFATWTQPGSVANGIIATLEGSLMICRLEGNRKAMLDAQAALQAMVAGLRA